MGLVRNLDFERPEAKTPINHLVVMFQLMRISLNVYLDVKNNERLFGLWGRISKRLE